MGALAEVAGDENSGEGSRTFVFTNEGHTLGNALKTIISRYPDVDFCGYTIPHPTENKMHFRIQSNQNRAIDILKRGFDDLESLCDHTINTFESEVKSFIETNNKPADRSLAFASDGNWVKPFEENLFVVFETKKKRTAVEV